jgi:hypothetical protein
LKNSKKNNKKYEIKLKNSCKKELIFHTFVSKAWSVHGSFFDKITPPQSLRITF